MNTNDVAVSTNTLIPELRHRAVCRRRLVAAIIEVSVFLVWFQRKLLLQITTPIFGPECAGALSVGLHPVVINRHSDDNLSF